MSGRRSACGNRLTALRRTATPDPAGSVLTLARLRAQARTKFPLAGRMFFSAEALEQTLKPHLFGAIAQHLGHTTIDRSEEALTRVAAAQSCATVVEAEAHDRELPLLLPVLGLTQKGLNKEVHARHHGTCPRGRDL